MEPLYEIMRTIFCFLAVAMTAVAPGLACSFMSTPHELDSFEQQIDRAAPEGAKASLVRIGRGRGPVHHDDGTISGSSCDHLGSISVRIHDIPRDDRTPAEKLGYRFVLAGGVLPEDFVFSEQATRNSSGELFVHWQDGATDEQEPIEFALSLIVVDLGGNESSPSEPIRVQHPGSQSQPD